VTNQEFAISSGTGSHPAIDGDLVVWSAGGNIFGRRLSGGPEFAITNSPLVDDTYPDVSNNLVVWQQSNTARQYDIYGAFVPEPTGAGLLGLCGALTLRRRRRA
jgi:hypothetical protein